MIRQNIRKVVLCQRDPYIYEVLFITMTGLSNSFLRIVKHSSMHKLQLGFVNVFIVTIGCICNTTLDMI